jgi:two-component system sensor histidine kinase KdpD
MDGWRQLRGYGWALAATAAASLAGIAMAPRFALVNIAMVYLLGVALVALRQSRGAAVVSAVASIVALDWLFVPPQGAFSVDDVQYVFTFGAMLVIALVISRLTEQARRQARAQAELAIAAESERIRSTLLASISHDLRTPLAVLTGASSSLAERGEAMSAAERVALSRSLYARSREMADHVDKMLDMTRLDAGAVVPDREWISIPEIVAALMDKWGVTLARHRVIVDVPPDLPLVRADGALLGKALGNLLENAARHTPPETPVRVRAERTSTELVLSVEDFGGGLDDVQLERVFAKFHHGAAEGPEAGLGLGLAICRSIVRLHGGRAWAARLDGGGSAFRIALPLETAPRVPLEPETL